MRRALVTGAHRMSRGRSGHKTKESAVRGPMLYKGWAATVRGQGFPMHRAAAVSTFCFVGLVVSLLPSALAWGQATINVPADQPTIQAGINAASDGDTILVAPGKYVENIDFLGKAITVTSSGGAANTILDGGATGPTVTFASSEQRTSVLSGLTIQNGGGYGTNTTAPGVGGVIVSYSSPTIQNNIITQNQCWDVEILYGAPLIQDNNISSTQSPVEGCGPGGGAGIYVGGNLDGDASTSTGSAAIIDANTIEDITIPSTAEASATFTNLAGENSGAGIAILAGSPLIENNIIRNNSAPGGNGGGINVAGGAGSTIAQNLIYGNSAGCGGGAISFTGTSSGTATNLLVANNTIVDNIAGATGPYSSCGNASQIYGVNFGLSSPHVVFVNNVISGNSAAPAVGCFSLPTIPSEAEQSIFDHNLLYNAGGSFFGSSCIDVSSKYGNVATAPQFSNQAQADFHLLAASPGIDTGNNSGLGNISALSGVTLATDLDGNPRVQDATSAGYPIIDLGAYERGGAVDGSPTTVVLASSIYSGTPGSPLVLTALAKSAAGVPGGSLTFFLDGQPLGTATITSQGYGVLNTVVPSVGVHSLYASYPATGSFTAARSVIIIVTGEGTPASKTYTTDIILGANINPQTAGQGATFTILVSSTDPDTAFIPAPITLTLGNGAVLASLTPNKEGIALFTTSTLRVGANVITASYAGDATHQATSTSFTEDILGVSGAFALYCSPMTITVGQTADLTVNLDAAGGTVVFRDDGVIFGEVPVVTGTVKWTYVGRSVGTHAIAALYPAFGANASNSAACYVPFRSPIPPDIIVVGLPTTSVLSVTPAAATFQTTRTMTATVSPVTPPGLGTPTGTVSFMNGATPLGRANLVGGVATLNTITLPAGTDSVTCSYSGDSIYGSSNCNTVAVTTSIAQATLALSSSANPAPALTPITFEVQLTATGQPVPVKPLVTVSVAGQDFFVTLDANGKAGVVVSTLMPGTYLVTASFPGNVDLLSATASLTETVVTSPSMTALSATPSPGYVGQPVTLTAMVTAQDTLVPTGGVVTFYDGTTVLGTGTLDATRSATLTTTMLAIGTHSLTATYPGAGIFTESTSLPFNETILAPGTSTTTSLTVSPNPANAGQAVTLTSVVTTANTQVPAGTTITFYDQTTVLGTGTLDQSRTATFTTSGLAIGTHLLTASYTGTTTFGGSTSPAVIETILAKGASSFSIAISPTTVTVPTDQAVTIAIRLSSINGFAGPLALNYGPLPVNASASIVPPVVTLSADATGSSTLTLNTATPGSAVAGSAIPRGTGWTAVFAAMLILFLPGRKRLRWRSGGRRLFFWLALTASLLQTVIGCGNSFYTLPGVAPGTYRIQVSAMDVNQNKQTTVLTLVVPSR